MRLAQRLGGIFFGLILAFMFSGCAVFLLGAGAAGGYAITDDDVQGHMDKDFTRVWRAAEEVIVSKGIVKESNEATGIIKAEVEGSKIEIRILQVTPKTVQLTVEARKVSGLFPNLKLAEKLYKEIVEKTEKRGWF